VDVFQHLNEVLPADAILTNGRGQLRRMGQPVLSVSAVSHSAGSDLGAIGYGVRQRSPPKRCIRIAPSSVSAAMVASS